MLKSIKMNSLLAAAAITVVGFATPAAAQSAPATGCPAQYAPMEGGLCIKAGDGDIVLAETPAAAPAPVYTNADCRAGYYLMIDNLCMSSKTGDVVFAEKAAPAQVSRPVYTNADCLNGYDFLMDNLCMNRQSGLVVYVEPKVGNPVLAAKK